MSVLKTAIKCDLFSAKWKPIGYYILKLKKDQLVGWWPEVYGTVGKIFLYFLAFICWIVNLTGVFFKWLAYAATAITVLLIIISISTWMFVGWDEVKHILSWVFVKHLDFIQSCVKAILLGSFGSIGSIIVNKIFQEKKD